MRFFKRGYSVTTNLDEEESRDEVLTKAMTQEEKKINKKKTLQEEDEVEAHSHIRHKRR